MFTRYLTQKMHNRRLQQFVEHWDQVEQLVIEIFKSKRVTTEDEAVYRPIRAWLLANYPMWEADLKPLWQATVTGGTPTATDPFRRIFSAENAADFLEDWGAMQHLASAREALNKLIVIVTQ